MNCESPRFDDGYRLTARALDSAFSRLSGRAEMDILSLEFPGCPSNSRDMNPLLHYVLVGERQGLAPSRHFDPVWYRQRYAVASSVSALAHYLEHRRTQRVSPLPTFDLYAYTRAHAATLLPNRDPYAHFLARRQFAPVEVARAARLAA